VYCDLSGAGVLAGEGSLSAKASLEQRENTMNDVAEDLGSARVSRAGDGVLAIANFSEDTFN